MKEYFVKITKKESEEYIYYDCYQDAKEKFLEFATNDIANIVAGVKLVGTFHITLDKDGIHETPLEWKVYDNEYHGYYSNDEEYHDVHIELKFRHPDNTICKHTYNIIYDNKKTINKSIKVTGECEYFNRI